jgi:hypothetical protein
MAHPLAGANVDRGVEVENQAKTWITEGLVGVAMHVLCVPSMGTVLMGFKSPVLKPEIMKMNNKIPAEVKVLRVIAALKEDDATPACG